jgi:hypothetical protein
LLRQQGLLRSFNQEQIDSIAAAGESRFQLQTKRDMGRVTHGSLAEPGSWRSTFLASQCRVGRAFATDARVDLHPSHLIQSR